MDIFSFWKPHQWCAICIVSSGMYVIVAFSYLMFPDERLNILSRKVFLSYKSPKWIGYHFCLHYLHNVLPTQYKYWSETNAAKLPTSDNCTDSVSWLMTRDQLLLCGKQLPMWCIRLMAPSLSLLYFVDAETPIMVPDEPIFTIRLP